MGDGHISDFADDSGAVFPMAACPFSDLLTCCVGLTQLSHVGPICGHSAPPPPTCQLREGRDVRLSFSALSSGPGVVLGTGRVLRSTRCVHCA